jgi:membrane-bound ClpP family serine protease
MDHFISTRRPFRLAWGLVALCALVASRPARADDAADAGLTVQLPAVITYDVTTRLRTAVYGPLKRYEAGRKADGKPTSGFKLLLEFTPDGKSNASDDYGACRALANYLRDLQRDHGAVVRGYAWADVTRHAVLPLLACGEIVLSREAHFGKVVDAGRTMEPDERVAYEEKVKGRYPLALVRKMFDKEVAVVKVFAADGDRYRDAAELAGGPKGEPVAELGRGAVATYSFAQAKEYGLCLPDAAASLDAAMKDFNLARTSMRPLLDHPVAALVKAEGTLDALLAEDIQRRVKTAVGDKANVIVLQLDCGGGDVQAAYETATVLMELNKDRPDKPVKTIAYVTDKATDTAMIVALGCDQIVMEKDARLGDFERFLKDKAGRIEALRKNLHDLAEGQLYPPTLAEGFVAKDLRVFDAVSTKGPSERRFLSDKELNDPEGQKNHGWTSQGEVKPAGQYLTLNADAAKKYGLAQAVVNGYDELCELEGVSPTEVKAVSGDWLTALARFLADPLTSVILVMIGVTCLILELKMPGVSLPGVIAAVCFVLFFWSHSQLNGSISWLAVLLFILGLVLIGVEIFILPGMGVSGISGVLLVIISIGLVAYGHWPQSNDEWLGYGQKLGPFGVGILVAIGLAFTLAKYLKYIPWANRLILKPQGEGADEDGESPPAESLLPELAGLLGAIGVAATPLRPAGKTQFGDQFVDVVAEGGYVRPGTRVQVIEIEGNRVVVKEV